jgi:hypothetical protein
MFLFQSLVFFIFWIGLLPSLETIISILFRLFSGFCYFLSHIYTYLDCAPKLVIFGVGFSFARTARR